MEKNNPSQIQGDKNTKKPNRVARKECIEKSMSYGLSWAWHIGCKFSNYFKLIRCQLKLKTSSNDLLDMRMILL